MVSRICVNKEEVFIEIRFTMCGGLHNVNIRKYFEWEIIYDRINPFAVPLRIFTV